MNLKRAIGGPLLSIVFLIFFAYMISEVQWVLEYPLKSQSDAVFLGDVSGALPNIQSVDEIELNAESAISVKSDLQGFNKVIFEKDSDTELPIASLTKLMTAVVVFENYNLSDIAVVSEIADSQDLKEQNIKLGDTTTIKNFLYMMLVGSSNKSARALSELVGEKKFVELMNQKAKDLGLKNTFFADPTGLSSENVSTASDLTKLAEYILNSHPQIADISKIKEIYIPGFGNFINTDQLLGEIPDIVCSKTGFTVAAKGCLLLIINNPKNNNYLINVILGADDRFSEMKKLINYSNIMCN